MPPVQPEASVASAGKQLRYIGDHVYANSGQVSITNSPVVSLLEFMSGSGYITAFWEVSYADTSGGVASDDYAFFLYFNDELLFNAGINSSSAGAIRNPLQILIPPFTKVIISAKNQTSSTEHFCYAILTGRVYGAK